jgi:hypothetical protein
MGTRNITQVIYQGKTVISHYCQWDGYLSSAGVGQLAFLNGTGIEGVDAKGEKTGKLVRFEREQFIANLQKVKILSKAELDVIWETPMREFWLTRDSTGYNLLAGIQTGVCTMDYPDKSFVNNSLFCEWAYVLDLDNNTWEIYKGFNKRPLAKTQRFYKAEPDEDGYYPVRLFKKFSLSKLPKNLDKLINAEDEEYLDKLINAEDEE